MDREGPVPGPEKGALGLRHPSEKPHGEKDTGYCTQASPRTALDGKCHHTHQELVPTETGPSTPRRQWVPHPGGVEWARAPQHSLWLVGLSRKSSKTCFHSGI